MNAGLNTTREYAQYETASQARDKAPMDYALAELEGATKELTRITDALNVRLQPVLMPDATEAKSPNGPLPVPDGPTAQVVGNVRDLTRMIQAQVSHLQRLNSRLAV